MVVVVVVAVVVLTALVVVRSVGSVERRKLARVRTEGWNYRLSTHEQTPRPLVLDGKGLDSGLGRGGLGLLCVSVLSINRF